MILYPFSFAASQSIYLSEKEEALLAFFNVINEDTDYAETLTRGQFAQMLSNVISVAPIETLADSSIVINDIEPSSSIYLPVTVLYAFKIAFGDENGNFNPNEPISYEHAAIMIVRTLGLNENLVEPLQFLRHLNIHISIANVNSLTIGEGASLIYNMLNAKIDFSNRFDGDVSVFGSGDYLERRLGMKRVSGVVNYAAGNHLYADENGYNDKIKINDKIYDSEINEIDLIGRYVEGYYKTEKDKDTLLYLYVDRTDEIKINAKYLLEVKNNSLSYLLDLHEQKERKVNLKNGFIAVYNGMPVKSSDLFGENLLLPDTGSITLVDNNHDSVYDVVLVDSYTDGIVGAIDTAGNSIFIDGLEYKLNDYDNVVIKNSADEVIDLNSIKQDSVASVGESLDGKLLTIIVSDSVVSGMITEISEEGVCIDNTLYHIKDNIKDELKIGKLGKFYLNYDNVIIKARFTGEEYVIKAFLIDAEVFSEGFSEKLKIKAYMETDKIEILDVSENVIIDGISYKEKSPAEMRNALLSDDGSFRQIILLTFASDMTIRDIDTPKTTDSEDSVYHLYKFPRSDQAAYTYSGKSLNGVCTIDENTTIFFIPYDQDESNMCIIPVNKMSSDQYGYRQMKGAYAVSKESLVADAVVLTGEFAYPFLTSKCYACIVENTYTTLDDSGETVLGLELSNYNRKHFTMLADSERVYGRTQDGSFKEVEIGDVIVYGDNNAVIKNRNLDILYDCSEGTFMDEYSSMTLGGMLKMEAGYVYSMKDNALQLASKNPLEGLTKEDMEALTIYFAENANVFVYDEKTKGISKIRESNIDEIRTYIQSGIGDKVVCYFSGGAIKAIFVYRLNI